MNSTHDSKDWHMSQASLQNSCLAESSSSQPPMQHYPPMDHHYAQSFTQGPMHPPVHQLSSPNNYLPPGKTESDPRLPGMMALSQPGTPRPTHSPTHPTSPTSKKPHTNYATSSFHAAPYSHPSLARKRGGRNELFSTELGPFFSSTKPFDNLYALDRSTLLTVRIQAKMDRGFFLADNDWTCYRRNYFQVSGAFSIHGLNHYYADQETQCLVQIDGQFYPVHNFSMNISARVSNSDKKIELVQHTPKRDKGPQTTPAAKMIMPGGNLSMSSVGANQSIVTFERIQFKTATANNGKRRAAQQYYVCLVDLYAEIEGNKKVKIASCQSAPLVVRGRSPGHYSDNHDRFDNGMPTPNSQQPPQQHDDRFNASFPRPPITPPGVMGAEYGSHYSYQPYSNYPPFNPMPPAPLQPGMLMGSAPPTPTGPPPSQQHGNQSSHSYMIPSMTSDPSSSETSSPDLYNGEFNHGAQPPNGSMHGDSKFNHSPQLPHPHNNGLNIHMPMENGEWSRSRMNSTGHVQSPAGPYEQQQQHNSYFSSNSSNGPQPSAFSASPASPASPYGARKYPTGGHSIQQQAS